MTKIVRCADCGNSPKNQLVEDLAIALETGQGPQEALADDASWNKADGHVLRGRDTIAAGVPASPAPRELTVLRVSSHGKAGSALGRADGRTFAHFFEFASAAAKSVVRIDSFSKTER